MNTKKLLYGLLTCLILFAAACTSGDIAEEDKLYEIGVDKRKIIINKESVDKRKIIINKESVDKRKIIINKDNE